MLIQRRQHPHLDSSKARAAREDERHTSAHRMLSITTALTSTTPLAPSDKGLELPAVMLSVPGWGRSAASFSSVVSSRIDSS
jgi:hypothetical protein